MTKLDTGDFGRPEPFRLAGVIGGCCDARPQGARPGSISCRCAGRHANRRRRRAQADPDQSCRTPSSSPPGGRPDQRPVEGPRRSRSGQRHRHRREDLPRIGEPFFERAAPTTGVTTAPASASRSSRAWWRCTAATSRSAAGSGRHVTVPCRSIASRRPQAKTVTDRGQAVTMRCRRPVGEPALPLRRATTRPW